MNREDVAKDLAVENNEVLRERIEQIERALAGMLFAFDDGVGQTWSADVLDFARQLVKAKEFEASQHGEQATHAEAAQVQPEQAEGAQGEREAFEVAAAKLGIYTCNFERYTEETATHENHINTRVEDPVRVGDYRSATLQDCWKVWQQARAALAQPFPAPELERPEGEQ